MQLDLDVAIGRLEAGSARPASLLSKGSNLDPTIEHRYDAYQGEAWPVVRDFP